MKNESTGKFKVRSNDKSSYRQIFKASTVFGGVQIVSILIGLIRAKIVSVLLGTLGYGIFGLLNSPLVLIQRISSLGISYSAVRDISEANASGNKQKLATTISVFQKWIILTALLGLLLTIVLSPLLSQWSFGDYDYIIGFIILSVVVFINTLSGGKIAILQGRRMIKDNAKASVSGAFLGLIASVPFYYYFGINGIIPAFVIAALATYSMSWYYVYKNRTPKIHLLRAEVIDKGKSFIKLGFFMTLTSSMTAAITYIVSAYISFKDGPAMVGVYAAGWALSNQYVAMVFNAMGADYFPKLSAIQHDNNKIRSAVNQQAEITILVLLPIVLLFLTLLPYIIKLLFTIEFMPAIPFTEWIIVGMLFKAASWAMGYIILSKGHTKLFFWTELFANSSLLSFSLIGYELFGLEGIGMAFILLYILYFLLMLIICHRKYNFRFAFSFNFVFFFSLVLTAIYFISIKTINTDYDLISGIVFSLIAIVFSLYHLNRRIEFKEALRKLLKSKQHNEKR